MEEREEKMESEMGDGKFRKWEQGMCNGVYGRGGLMTTCYSQPCRHEIMQDGKIKHTHIHISPHLNWLAQAQSVHHCMKE